MSNQKWTCCNSPNYLLLSKLPKEAKGKIPYIKGLYRCSNCNNREQLVISYDGKPETSTNDR